VVVIVITARVVISAMVVAHHNRRMMMMTGISVVVSVSEVNRYTTLFRDHQWPLRGGRSRKRGTGEKNSDTQCCTGEHHYFFHDFDSPRLIDRE
jgi:hypothetical protein